MNTTMYIFLLALISCTTMLSMEIIPQKPLLPEGIILPIEDIWLNIIARCSAKDSLRKTCTYFRDFASTKNKEIFLQNPFIIKPECLEDFALYYADLNEDAIIRNLLDQGLNPNTNASGMSLLHYAAKNGNLSLSETLLKHPKFIPANATAVQIDDCNNYIKSPFKFALSYNQLAIAKRILTIEHINLDEVLATYRAHASDSNINILTDILSLKIDHQKLSGFLSELLYNAASKEQIALVTLLLKQKNTNVNYKRPWESTPLCHAAACRNMPILKLLIEHGAQLDEVLNYANDVHTMRFLIDQGASLHVKEEHGYTLLAQTITSARGTACANIVQLLLDRGTDVNEIVDNDGNVALGLISHTASSCHKAIKVLLDHPNINVDIKNNEGKTPLNLACEARERRKGSLDVPDWDYLIDQIKQHKEKNHYH
jgi:ankyrin repeat protein